MRAFLLSSSIAAAALLVAGCSTTYSELSGNRYYRTPIDTYPVSIVKIDGESPLRRDPVYIEPGVRKITVQAPPGAAHRYGDEQTLTLDVKPCTRYWIVAVKEGPLTSEFKPKVDHQEPIASCTAS
jgi:hypothetical protein